MSDPTTRCASCGLPGHRYGRNEGMDRYDPMACINQLRGVLEDLLANGQRVEPDYEAAAEALHGLMQRGKPWEDDPPGKLDHYRKLAHAAVDAAIGDKLLTGPTTEEEK